MKNNLSYLYAFFLMICLLPVTGMSAEAKTTLTIGSISNTPKEEILKFQPFIDYVVSRLKDPNIKAGRVAVAGSLEEMADLINKNKVDLYLDSPFPTIAVRTETGSIPFLRRWKKGVKEYSSVIFVRKDSGINSLADLKGKMIAFEEEFSTSGYFLPKATLLEKKLNLLERLRKHASVPKRKVGYVFSRDDETTMIWVMKNKVAAGALSKRKYLKLAKSKIKDLKILKETILVPRQVVSHNKNIDKHTLKKIRKILIDMDKNDKGKSILAGFSKTKKFEPLSINELNPIIKLYDWVFSDFGL